MDDLAVRHAIYETFAATGAAPTVVTIAHLVGDRAEAERALRRLHERHMVVLGDDGEIRMALPFSAVPTAHRVIAATGAWWANCAWDALAIPAALGVDASIEATWLDTGEPVDLAVDAGALTSTDGFVHFAVAARHWWDDIVET